MDKLHYIESLVDRFLEGRTTNAEEHELYEWFATADVPDKWSDLKAMFAWYAEGMPDKAAPAKPKPRMTLRLRRLVLFLVPISVQQLLLGFSV